MWKTLHHLWGYYEPKKNLHIKLPKSKRMNENIHDSQNIGKSLWEKLGECINLVKYIF